MSDEMLISVIKLFFILLNFLIELRKIFPPEATFSAFLFQMRNTRKAKKLKQDFHLLLCLKRFPADLASFVNWRKCPAAKWSRQEEKTSFSVFIISYYRFDNVFTLS